MTVPKNVLLALIAVVIIALFGVVGFILLKPKVAVAPATVVNIVAPTPTPSPTPPPVGGQNQIKLTITSPVDGSIVKISKLSVKGVTVPSAEVSINDLEVKADAKGNFSGSLTLEEGDNPISILAVDENGNYSETELTVTYEP
ncbi:MAG: hypothetical protein Q7S14_01670 [bacterium]|nr:hypothetical protein [bacterium]